MQVRILSNGIEELKRDRHVADQLGEIAQSAASRVQEPRGFTVTTKDGVGPRGAFAQVIMSGPGAVAVEYGSLDTPAHAPLRRAIRTE